MHYFAWSCFRGDNWADGEVIIYTIPVTGWHWLNIWLDFKLRSFNQDWTIINPWDIREARNFKDCCLPNKEKPPVLPSSTWRPWGVELYYSHHHHQSTIGLHFIKIRCQSFRASGSTVDSRLHHSFTSTENISLLHSHSRGRYHT